jgi:hypothetical protein
MDPWYFGFTGALETSDHKKYKISGKFQRMGSDKIVRKITRHFFLSIK